MTIKKTAIATLGIILSLQCAELFAGDAANSSQTMVPLKLVLPPPDFKETPKELAWGPAVEPLSTNARPLMMVPSGLSNIALRAKLSTSDNKASSEKLQKIVNGDKMPNDENIICLRKGSQWVRMDFDKPQEIYAIVIWHSTDRLKVVKDVIVQAADDPDMIENVHLLFNNDKDNSSGMGVGTDREYVETYEGKLLDTKGMKASSLRFFSNGNTESTLNEYTEIEVYGRPAK